MFCGECGTQNPDTNQFCKNCGKPLKKAQPSAAPQPVIPPVPSPATFRQTIYQPPAGYAPATGVPADAPAGVTRPPLSKGLLALGIAGIVIGIVSWFFYPYLCGIAAVLLGGVSFFRSGNKKGIVAIIAILAILIGLASILVDNFYFILFPPKEIVITLLSVFF